MILVLLPFWTSLLVRTSAWKVLLQQQGVINDVLVWWVSSPMTTADPHQQPDRHDHCDDAYPSAVHDPSALLGDEDDPPLLPPRRQITRPTDWTAFWRVYFPQSVPGIGAGSILVFILAIGYYITPELVAAPRRLHLEPHRLPYQLLAELGLAAALGTILLAVVLLLYWVYDRIVGIDNVKLG